MSNLLNDFSLEFEKPLRDLENQIQELKDVTNKSGGVDLSNEIKNLQKKVDSLLTEIYGNLTPWDRVQLSRHPKRPHSKDYIEELIDDFREVSGDRRFANDPAIITGFGYLDGQKVAIVGIEKGRKTKEKVIHNFGMPRPEGYRKALRIMQTAAQFKIPVIAFVDTPGAYPGIGAEERGQSEAIAKNLAEMFDVKTPIIACVIGEGGSGGALGVAIADKVLMMEYSIYSVISPESCASILWADPKMAETAANSLQLSPKKALELKVIDGIIPEPTGGAQRDWPAAMTNVRRVLGKEITDLLKKDMDNLLEGRFNKFRSMGNQTIIQ